MYMQGPSKGNWCTCKKYFFVFCALNPLILLPFLCMGCGEDGVDTVTGQQDDYVVVVKSCCHFDLCIRFVASGASFRMASCLMDCIKDESGMSVFGGCSDVVASNYTCIVCAHSLQIISDIMQQTWEFTLAFDGSTHQGMSYLDV